jgi:hypothetical protein
MAISLGYGIVFATLITLIIVPSVYLIIDDIRNIFVSRPLNRRQNVSQ